jgi:anti-sigma regulatory factor (Ser/Thr protein kinase)
MGTVGEYQRLCERENAAGRRVRSTGPVPFGEDPAVRAEWMRYEALLDRALGPYRFTGLCRYDTRSTSAEVMDLALATHRHVVTPRGARPNPEVRPAAQLLHELTPRDPRHPLEDLPPVLDQPDCPTEVAGRQALRLVLPARDAAADPAETVTAVSEVLGNAFRHGGRPVGLRVHTDGRRWLCTVTDHGPGIADPWAGVDAPLPGNPRQVGAGLWLARQLCDRLTITRAAGGGAQVRLLFDTCR